MSKTTNLFVAALLLVGCTSAALPEYPVLQGSDETVVAAYDLAVKTVSDNIDENGLITAGGEYGGEWTRDISINTWNCCNLLFPEESVYSLWSVTVNDGETVGHQYWDKIIWVTSAWNQYLVLGDVDMLKKAYVCSAATMKELEDSVFDPEYGLFQGPSVFNDGIAGYEEPIPDNPLKRCGSIENSNTEHIKCLSTNDIYYMAYITLEKMANKFGDAEAAAEYAEKAAALRENIRKYLYDAEGAKLNYLVDHLGNVHNFQEGLGYSFAILGGVVTPEEAAELVKNVHVSAHGIPSIYPDFKRFSTERHGRHNNIIWPFVNAFYAEAALAAGDRAEFMFELTNLADLAMNKSNGNFLEIYNPETGLEDGGWQIGRPWHSCYNQTWSATGYVRMLYNGVFGISFEEDGMLVNPDAELMQQAGVESLTALRYRNAVVNIALKPADAKHSGLYLNGKKVAAAKIPARSSRTYNVVLYK